MDFKSTAPSLTDPKPDMPLSHFPAWYARIHYWLNYAFSNDQAFQNNSQREAAFFEPFLNNGDYATFIDTAIEHKIISDRILRPEKPFVDSMLKEVSDEERRAKRKEREDQFNREVDEWFLELKKLMEKLDLLMSKEPSVFGTNLKLLSDTYDLKPIEGEILALLSSSTIAKFVAHIADDAGGPEEYAEEIARCLGVHGDNSRKYVPDSNQEHYDKKEIEHVLFKETNLTDAHLLEAVDGYYTTEFIIDDDTLDLLNIRGLTQGILLARTIGTVVTPELDFEEDCDYLDFRDEMVNSLIGCLKRDTTQGKMFFLVGPPGSGKSVLPATVADYIKSIMQKTDEKFDLPTYVIGIDESEGKTQKKRRAAKRWSGWDISNKEGEASEKNNAQDRDVRKLLRARQMLKKLNIPAILVVEEADGILATLVSEQGSAMTRALRSQVLDHSPVITFLISNHPEKFDAAANRRLIRYTMATPPPDKRKRMVMKMSRNFGLDISDRDASTLAKAYTFTPGVIKSAIQYLADIVDGQIVRELRKDRKVSLEEITMAFQRKAVTLAGTTIKMSEKIETPEKIDRNLYHTDDLETDELDRMINGKMPARLWLLAGRPETEILDLAVYSASQDGDCEIIQIGAVGSDLIEQLESAKRNKTPLVITGFDKFTDRLSTDALREHPFMIAVQDHVRKGYPVFLISNDPPRAVPDSLRALFGGAKRAYVGFDLMAGFDLVEAVTRIAGLPLPSTAALFSNSASNLTAVKSDDYLLGTGGHDGLLIAGPKDIRVALQTVKEDNRQVSLESIFQSLHRQGVKCTWDRETLKFWTGFEPKDDMPYDLN